MTPRRPQTKKRRRTRESSAKRMLYRQIFVGVALVLLIAAVLTGVWHLTRMPQLTITSVTAAGGLTISAEEIVAVAENELAGSYYRLIPKRFTYLYPHDVIQNRIEAVPRVKTVSLTKPTRRELHLQFTEYEPAALWCESDNTECVFIDAAGYAFATAPSLSGSAFIRYENQTTAPTVGTVGVPNTLLANTTAVTATLAQEFSWRVTRVSFDDRDVTYHLGGGGALRSTRDADVESVLTNLETILTSDDFDHLAPGNFQYVDLRYGNKVFVQEELLTPEPATSTATTTN